jgi:acetyl-CoA carboxylase biotin carboxyl carrier protein
MAERTLIAKVRPDEKEPEILLVTSPVVGIADGAPPVGAFLNPFDRVITLKVLNRRFVLRLPRNVHGRVVEAAIPNGFTPVEYGGVIARLDPRALEASGEDVARSGSRESADAEDAGAVTVSAPSDGIFYRKPGPDSPPYVEVGAEVTAGSILGLVEIMKCFHQITYGGIELPERGKVTRILADDASEVRFGQALFQVKPV